MTQCLFIELFEKGSPSSVLYGVGIIVEWIAISMASFLFPWVRGNTL